MALSTMFFVGYIAAPPTIGFLANAPPARANDTEPSAASAKREVRTIEFLLFHSTQSNLHQQLREERVGGCAR